MALQLSRALPDVLRDAQVEISAHAHAFGLDFFEVLFEVVDRHELNAVAALGGFPTRYPHWRFGMEYEQLAKSHTWGLSKIYELVINNDPCYAYLLDSNSLTDQKLVMAHVYGHCDFFKSNLSFAHTNRKMVDEMANHGNRIRGYMDRHGVREVEDFIDVCLSLEDLIDPHSTFIRRKTSESGSRRSGPPEEEAGPIRFEAKPYLDAWMNPRRVLEEERRRLEESQEATAARFPAEEERDVLLFLMEHGRLKGWQHDVLGIIREESYYFAPQAQTKIMNEGWASYWHSKIMCERGLTDAEVVDFADHHSGTMAMPPGSFNPYKIGLELYRDIEERWDQGRFGKEYEECDDADRKCRWDLGLGLGREKLFEVRRVHNDVTFVDTFLTEEFCHTHRLFSFAYEERRERYEIESREFAAIKERLLFALTNHGRPFIRVVDGNFRNRGELLLRHEWLGVELRADWAADVLVNLWRIWGRPVHLETVVDDEPTVLGFDGSRHLSRHRSAGGDDGE